MMMKNIFDKIKNATRSGAGRIWHVMWLLSVSVLAACTAETDYPDVPGATDNGYVITLTTGTMSRAATFEGIGVENLIHDYVIFFYKTGETDPVYAIEGTPNNSSGTVTVSVKLKDDVVDKLFGSGTTCTAYAFVNVPDGKMGTNSQNQAEQLRNKVTIDTQALTINGKKATIEEIEATKIYRRFGTDDTPTEFVMHGQSDNITLDEENRKLNGTISLKRVAAKVRLFVNLPEVVYIDGKNNRAFKEEEVKKILEEKMAEISGMTPDEALKQALAEFEQEIIDGGGKKCIPFPNYGNNIRVFMQNGCRVARIDGSTEENGERWMDSWDGKADGGVEHNPYFTALRTSDQSRWKMAWERPDPSEDEYADWHWNSYERTHGTPIYSYPNQWDVTTIEEQHQSYLLMALDWHIWDKDNFNVPGSIDAITYYYQIPINSQSNDAHCMRSNKYYRIGLTVGMLGSFNMGDPQLIEDASWEVLDWNVEDVNMDLQEGRYIVFNESDFVLNNEQSIEIPFVSSHEIEVKEVYVTYFKFNDTWGGTNNSEFNTKSAEYDRLADGEGLIRDATYGDVYSWKGYYDEYYVGREHPRTISNLQLTRTTTENSQNNAQNWNLYKEKYGIDAMYSYGITGNNKIYFNHPLIRWQEVGNGNIPTHFIPVMNSTGTGFKDAYSRYNITIIVGFKNEDTNTEKLRKTIHIIQYPALYVEVSHNYGNVSVNNGNSNNGNEYVKINGLSTYVGNNGQNGPWEIANQGIFGVTNSVLAFNGTNNNPNMYVITTTQISEDNDKLYKIGDPRTLTRNNNLSDGSITNPAQNNPNNAWTSFDDPNLSNQLDQQYTPATNAFSWTNGQASTTRRTIQNYYPTDETTGSGSKEDFIAPSIRVASSFGKIGSLTQKMFARRRCAAYQEAGRPGGRWRMPTKAELLYIMQLSEERLIPILFGTAPGSTTNNETTNAYYWTANGLAHVQITGTANNIVSIVTNFVNTPPTGANPAVRCVYDEWYWLKNDGTPDITREDGRETTFYWGDKEKDNPQLGD